jgi:multiple sugar transport system permease protein
MTVHHSLWSEIRRNRNAYLFIAPFYIVFLTFMIFPIGFSLFLSLFRWNGIMAPRFVGLLHYQRALSDDGLLNALINTAVFTALTVGLSSVIGIVLAVFLNSVKFLKRFYRGVFFVPAIVSLVVVSLVWKLILNSEVGLVHESLSAFGRALGPLLGYVPEWTQVRHHFLDNQNRLVPLLTITFVNVWGVVGFNTVIYLAGLQGIPAHLYEASRIDGATPLQDFFHITLPLLRPTVFFVVLISMIDAMQVFVLPAVMNRNAESTMTIVYYLFRNAFEFYKMGYASAIAYLLFGITVVLGISLRLTLGRNTRWAAEE